MLHLLEEVHVSKMHGDQRLQKAEEEVLILNRKIKTLEKKLQEHHAQCTHREHWRHNSNKESNDETERLLQSPFQNSVDKQSEEKQNTRTMPRHQLLNAHNDRVLTLIDGIGQEMAVLFDKQSSSSKSNSLLVKLELLKELVGNQLLHDAHVNELRKTLSSYEKRLRFLEEHLSCVQTLSNAQDGNTKLVPQKTHKVKDCMRKKQTWSEDRNIQGRHTVPMEQLQRATEESTSLQTLLECRTQEGNASSQLLEKRKFELKPKQQESEQRMALTQDQCQKLHPDLEFLKRKLQDIENINETLRFQLKHNIQQTEQYNSTSQNLHQDISLLSDQLNHLKLDILHIRAELDHYKSKLAAVEREKLKLQASETEKDRRVQEEVLAKQQLSMKLERQGMQLLSLTEEHKELHLLYSCMNKEKEGVVRQLQSHLKNVQTELNQAKSTLRTLEQKDNHGLQMAQTMQTEITDKRRHIDSLQSKIQGLEEAKEKLCQDKLYLKLENKRQCQELALALMEKKRLAKELDTVKSRDKHLKKRISEFEAVLHTMSGSFVGCQEFIQLQEYYRLKLKHILGLKEESQNACIQRNEGRSSDVRSLLFKEQYGVKKHRPHTVNTTDANFVCRRGSAPKSVQSTAFSTDNIEVQGGTKLRRKPSRSESHQKTPNLKELFSQEPLTSTPSGSLTSPQLLGRRSPVHTLLTSDPNS